MKNRWVQYNELSSGMKEEIEVFHLKNRADTPDIGLAESIERWFDSEFDDWVVEKFDIL